MAYHQIRQRDPLLDSRVHEALTRRGRELLGLALLAFAAMAAALLASYVPEDPNWLSATDEPVNNLLGRAGSSAASVLFLTIGHGSWGIVVLLAVWGLRFLLHRGAERVLSRIIFAPIAIALAAVMAATHVPASGWTHSFGMGGLFGDTVLGAILSSMPQYAAIALRVVSAAATLATVALGLFVLGTSRAELKEAGRFLALGVLLSYVRLVDLASRGARAGAAQVRARLAARAEARETARNAAPPEGYGFRPAQAAAPHGAVSRSPLPRFGAAVIRPAAAAPAALAAARSFAAPVSEGLDMAAAAAPAPRRGILPRLGRLVPRSVEPELVDPTPPAYLDDEDAPTDERIRARIAHAVKNRATRPTPVLSAKSAEAAAAMSARRAVLPAASHAGSSAMDDFDPDDFDIDDLDADDDDLDAALYEKASPAPGIPRAPAPATPPLTRRPMTPPPELRPVVQHPPRRDPQPSRRAAQEAQPGLRFDDAPSAYAPPPLGLLAPVEKIERSQLSDEALEENARMLESVLDDYGVKGDIVSVRPGPVVTMYELEPAPGLKASRVIGLADDIARSMSALSARVSTVPGRSVIGIELPNAIREKVMLREILSARDFGDTGMRLPLALGKDIGGGPVVANLARMPHLLIAGTTGSGKSVAINTMILSLLYKLSPEECRLIMIDPKMLELSVYDGIPHLLSPVVTDPKKAVVALKWVVSEMEDRYRKMSKMGVRNIDGFNGRVREALAKGEMFSRTVQTGFDDATGEPVFETEQFQPETLPFIVVIVDEMADLMMVAGKEIEACIQRLAQMARASGIHLIMATQRPSVDVITGTIKANFPTRISFQVTSKIDSRTILGEQGAEQLLGQGDMLYMAGGGRIQRVHGPFVSDEEVEEVVNHLKSFGPPSYRSGVLEGPEEGREADIDAVLGLGSGESDDALYDQAVAIVAKDRKCSTSYIQRKLAIGYNKAARLVEQMEDQGIVSPANHVGKREVLVPEV